MDLFEFIKVLFKTNSKDYNEVSSLYKKRNFFMVNRRMAIQFPLQANSFNNIGINPITVVNMWRRVGSKFGKVPSWMYTKTKTQKKEKLKWSPSNEVIDKFLEINKIGDKEYQDAYKLNRKELFKYLQIIDKTINSNTI